MSIHVNESGSIKDISTYKDLGNGFIFHGTDCLINQYLIANQSFATTIVLPVPLKEYHFFVSMGHKMVNSGTTTNPRTIDNNTSGATLRCFVFLAKNLLNYAQYNTSLKVSFAGGTTDTNIVFDSANNKINENSTSLSVDLGSSTADRVVYFFGVR